VNGLKPEIYKQRTPCDDCPFRREGGVRHSRSMLASYIAYFLDWPGVTFPCHKSVPKDDDRSGWSAWREGQVLCSGGMIFALKHGRLNAVMAAGLQSGDYQPQEHRNPEAVFDTVDEMLEAGRCQSTLSEMRCSLDAGHGRFHKSGSAGWEA
jgi:hypothetical protein